MRQELLEKRRVALGDWGTLILRQRQLRVEPVGWLREHLEGRAELPAQVAPALRQLLEEGQLQLEVATLRVQRTPARKGFDPALMVEVSVPERRKLVAQPREGLFEG